VCVLRICHFSLALALRCPIHFSLALALASCGAACRGLRSDTDQEGADAVYVPTPTMAALSPDPPSSPMFDDAQRQPGPGTDHEGADAVDAPMAMERRRSQYPSPRSKSGARWRQTTTDKGHVAQMRIVLSGQSNALIALLNMQHGGKIRMATITRCVEAVLLRRMAPVTATPDLSVISVLTWLNSPWLHHVATSYAGHACSSGSMHSHPSLSALSPRSRY